MGLTSGNDEVEEPLSGSAKSDVHGTQTSGGDLRHENPAAWAPTELEGSVCIVSRWFFINGSVWHLRSPEVDAGDGDITEGGDRLALDRGLDTTVDTDDVHDDSLGGTGPQQTAAATEGIGDENEENEDTGRLDDTVDTGSEERGSGAGHSKVLEDLGSIVVLWQVC